MGFDWYRIEIVDPYFRRCYDVWSEDYEQAQSMAQAHWSLGHEPSVIETNESIWPLTFVNIEPEECPVTWDSAARKWMTQVDGELVEVYEDYPLVSRVGVA